MAMDASKVPVIVGVGQINDRPFDPAAGLDSLGLMEAALRAADEDAGGGWLPRLHALAVVDQISFRDLNPVTDALAARLGATPKITYQTTMASGDSPILLLNEAANRIASGEIEVAAVVGGEALRTAAQRAAQAAGGGSRYSAIGAKVAGREKTYCDHYGLSLPVDVYPLYENAGRAAYAQSLAEGQGESGRIWSLFSKVAAANPGAWIKTARSPEEIIETTAANRPLAFPYTKLMVANSSVNQGAGFLVTSLAKAREGGVPEARLVYVGRGAAAHEPDDILARDRYDRTPAMEISIRRAMTLNGVSASDLDHVELYSCFPCVPKMARRIIEWPLDRPATVFGGLTFGGGPIGNYMSHAVASMVHKLREGGGKGLLFANGGFATHNHTIVIGRTPFLEADRPHDFHFQAEADSARGGVPPIVPNYEGPGTIESYTVFYGRGGTPSAGVVVARSPAGERFLARVPADDDATIAFLTDGAVQPVGTAGHGRKGADGLVAWRREVG
jgi:acetyl-CoA C-acetyltransferase